MALTRTRTTLACLAVLAVGTGALADQGTALATGKADDTVLLRAIDINDDLATSVAVQADAQRKVADEARRKAEAEAKAKREAARERAARSAAQARKRLTTWVKPVSAAISTRYHATSSLWSSGYHTGTDFAVAGGTPVGSVGRGTVVQAGYDGSYGNDVIIKMSDGMYTLYGHLSSIDVVIGQSVIPGQRIGLSGATGNVTGPHLHFEVRTTQSYGSDVDPVAYLRAHGVFV
jgi:murein DD-endopeptidase MepM/ murein hydrolase activator NlpD